MPAALKDYYKILGLDRGADEEAIRSAYRRLALRYHPDVAWNKNASKRFLEVKEAYEVLSDPEKRRQYDRQRRQWDRDERVRTRRRKGGASQPLRRQGGTVSHLLESLVGSLGIRIDAGLSIEDLSGDPRRGRPKRRPGQKRSSG